MCMNVGMTVCIDVCKSQAGLSSLVGKMLHSGPCQLTDLEVLGAFSRPSSGVLNEPLERLSQRHYVRIHDRIFICRNQIIRHIHIPCIKLPAM